MGEGKRSGCRLGWRAGAGAFAVLVLAGIAGGGALRGAPALPNAPARAGATAPDAPFTAGGQAVDLKAYAGRKLMVWQVATWCPTCRAGLTTFAQHQALIDKSDLTVIVLRDYKNGGYPGAGIGEFAAQVAPSLLHDPHFVFGDDSKSLFELYNPRHTVDIYQLIAPDGRIALVATAPAVSFDRIEAFMAAKASP